MSYAIDVDLAAQDDIKALPTAALVVLAEAITVLTLTPWNGRPLNPDNPTGAVRTLAFGAAGLITYLVLEAENRVDVLIVTWAS